MKIIFNSDLLYINSLVRDSLPDRISTFLAECERHNHEVVLPLTTVYEFNKQQREFIDKEKVDINLALEKLRSYGIEVAEFNRDNLINIPNLLNLIQQSGLMVSIEQPSLNDFELAHEKACFHEAPHSDGKSDEMRDLVIWQIALRIAKDDGGAVLLSRDKVHTHHRGDMEAQSHSLIRVENFEEALEALEIVTSSAQKVKQIVEIVWQDVINSDLPLRDGAQLVSVKRPSFVNTSNGTTIVTADLKFRTGGGEIFESKLTCEFVDDNPLQLDFETTDENSQNKKYSLTFEVPERANDYSDRLNALQELL